MIIKRCVFMTSAGYNSIASRAFRSFDMIRSGNRSISVVRYVAKYSSLPVMRYYRFNTQTRSLIVLASIHPIHRTGSMRASDDSQ